VRLVEHGEQGAQVWPRVDHGAITHAARQHDLLVQPGAIAREDRNRVAEELPGACSQVDHSSNVATERLALDVCEVARFE
jgi:hypothetical protein